MAISISIGPLGIHSITSQEDYIKIVYDKTKSYQNGDKVTDKNLYANPFIPKANVFIALCIWLCLESSIFERTSLLFSEDDNSKSTSKNYCYQFGKLFRGHEDYIWNMMRYDHCNPHGIRKGEATKDTSGTTIPP